MTTTKPTLEGIRDAALLLEPPFSKTPLFRSEQLSHQLDAEVWLKIESINPIASFKSRGATVAISRAIASRGISEIVTSSTGNHGQGVALAARLRHVTSHVFMPGNPNPVKLAMIESLGAIVHKIGDDLDYAKAAAIAFATERGSYFVDDGEDVDVMEGAGTIGLEIAEALDAIDRVVFPMGSGNLVAGSATALKAIHPTVRVTAVQSSESPAMAESFAQRKAVELPATSVADGLECRVPATLALERVIALVDDVITVPDHDILRACRTMLEVQHLVTEPAGASSLAGAASVASELQAKRVVLVVSGANLTAALFQRAEGGERLF